MEQLQAPENRNPNMGRLIEEYGDSLLRMCFIYLRDLHLAEDAVQETYIKIYKHWHTFRGECSEKTWITGIAINICRSQLRGSWIRKVLLSNKPVPGNNQDSALIEDDTVLRAISRLKPKYKEAVLLFYYREMKTKEVAASLGISETAVSVRLNRAREMLKKELKGWYFNELSETIYR